MVKAWVVGTLLALLFILQIAPRIEPLFVPMSRYYEITSLTVEDAPQGTSPSIVVDRTIHRDFLGRFEVEIQRSDGSEFTLYSRCGHHSSTWFHYRTTRNIPSDADLHWWMGDPPCDFPPGKYKVTTTVYAKGPMGGELSTGPVDSNVFTILPAPKGE